MWSPSSSGLGGIHVKNRICIIGSGPTGIYTLKNLIESATPLDITIYEAESEAGKGTLIFRASTTR